MIATSHADLEQWYAFVKAAISLGFTRSQAHNLAHLKQRVASSLIGGPYDGSR